jgi:dephospho-CoA kinase
VAGVLGGIASGKSLVAAELERLGAVRINADDIAHEVLKDPDVTAALTERFGEEILAAGGEVDRTALGRVVFADDRALRFLEALVHPGVRMRIGHALEGLEHGAIVVMDAALLLENGLDGICDIFVMVESSPDNRELRATTQRGWQEGEVDRRERHQRSLDDKRSRANVVITNDGSPAYLRQQVEKLWAHLSALAGADDSPRRQS